MIMPGHRVRVWLQAPDGKITSHVEGILHGLDPLGVTVLSFGSNTKPTFYPMVRVLEVVDLGRAP